MYFTKPFLIKYIHIFHISHKLISYKVLIHNHKVSLILLDILQSSFLTKYPHIFPIYIFHTYYKIHISQIIYIYFLIHVTNYISLKLSIHIPHISNKLHLSQSTYTHSSYILQIHFPQSIYTYYKLHILRNLHISHILHTFEDI